jgi:hypothetical protein
MPSPEEFDLDMGIFAYPASAASLTPTWHYWHGAEGGQNSTRLGYAHGAQEAQAILSHLNGLAQSVGYRVIDESRYRWNVPAGCTNARLGCVYATLERRSAIDLAPLTEGLRRSLVAQRQNPREAAAFLLRLVQTIPYQVPDEQPFGLLPPATVMSEKRGDCDSKSLLLLHLLRTVGIRSLLISSSAHAHTMLGIAVPSSGQSFTVGSTRYAYAETTAQNSPLGFIQPALLSPNDWRTLPMPSEPPRSLRSIP